MKNKLLLIIISGLVALLALGAFFTRNYFMPPPDDMMNDGFRGRPVMHPRGNPYGRDFCNPEFMRSRLALDENEIRAVEKLNIRFDEEYRQYNDQLRPLRDKLREILRNPDPDMKEVRKTLKQMSDIELEIRILRISQGAEISRIIPPDKMEMLHHERRMRYRENFHNRMERRLQER
jgi:Spy/CpxP family protein refolding chaperone